MRSDTLSGIRLTNESLEETVVGDTGFEPATSTMSTFTHTENDRAICGIFSSEHEPLHQPLHLEHLAAELQMRLTQTEINRLISLLSAAGVNNGPEPRPQVEDGDGSISHRT